MMLLFFLLGLCCVAAGAGMIYLPAGIIAAGAGFLALSFILAKGSDPDKH